jgi:CheY-like chemotaxis protein
VRVVLVDDSSDLIDVLGVLLRNLLGFETRGAQTAEQALLAIREFKPHVTFIDIVLPGIGGLKLAGLIRGELLPTKLVALTGYCGPDVRAAAFVAGFDSFLVKPSSVKEIANAVDALTIGASTSQLLV